MKRLNVYVDGFNLYFGMKDAGILDCKWLDIHAFAEAIKHNSHSLNQVKYFTSRVNNNEDKRKRQTTYLDALSTTPVSIIYGQYRSQLQHCQQCPHSWYEPQEKMTDVNIATELLVDAFTDTFDAAIVISGDSDLVPPIRTIRNMFLAKELIVAFPPERQSNDLRKVATRSFVVGRSKLHSCQLAKEIADRYGNILKKPIKWGI